MCLEGEDAIGSDFAISLGVVVGEDAINPGFDIGAVANNFVSIPAIELLYTFD